MKNHRSGIFVPERLRVILVDGVRSLSALCHHGCQALAQVLQATWKRDRIFRQVLAEHAAGKSSCIVDLSILGTQLVGWVSVLQQRSHVSKF